MTAFLTGTSSILWLQQFSPVLDLPFKCITFLGNESFFLLFLPLVYWCIHRRIGAGLAILFLLSVSINAVVKAWLELPRPFMVDPSVVQLTSAEGNGFPSGHTQGAMVVWTYLAVRFNKSWLWGLAGALILLIPLSRLYLGVHFPIDVIGGYLIGGLLVAVFFYIEAPIAERIGKPSNTMVAGIMAAVLLTAAALSHHQGPYVVSSIAALSGVILGIAVERRWIGYRIGSRWPRGFGCLLCGFLGLAAVYFGLKALLDDLHPHGLMRFMRYFLVGMWTTAGAPFLFDRLIKNKKPIR